MIQVLLAWQRVEAAVLPTVDGRIAEGEYASHYLAPGIGMEVHWTVEGDFISFGLRAPARGWVAIGWDPTGPIMEGEDIILGYIRGKELFLQDYYASSSVTHANDVSLGGRDDVLESSGSEDERYTTIEFRRRLDTGDRFDRPITPGPHTVQLAYAPGDDFVTYHGEKRTVVTIDFFAGGAQEAGLFARPRSLGGGRGPLVPWLRTLAAGAIAIISVTVAYLLWPRPMRGG
ncbi:MAG: DOMON domain-containing protein [Armatimonadota bacterium]|nr:DOMON domain-containing protein [Armatimonadota bacterium]MDR7426491.1 DOMON domain-containing protein [Armatimonadota bacterium]MDR7463388.1 DOMON domain-containing protein [Armatimonadota bacterium]MDR7468557.1 DOMON domain-containing protein [Armatimonadota bacterium]MDR7475150.1 DOMON domain-containing protein [Armatimonadota bacterium]